MEALLAADQRQAAAVAAAQAEASKQVALVAELQGRLARATAAAAAQPLPPQQVRSRMRPAPGNQTSCQPCMEWLCG